MVASLQTVVRKRHEGPGSALTGTSYPDLVGLVEHMRKRDPRVIFDSLRPMGDEIWNMIDGERTVEETRSAALTCQKASFATEKQSSFGIDCRNQACLLKKFLC